MATGYVNPVLAELPGPATVSSSRVSSESGSAPSSAGSHRNRQLLRSYHDFAMHVFSNSRAAHEGEQLFLSAVREGDYRRVENFIRRRNHEVFNIDAKDLSTGDTPLITACRGGDARMVQLLLQSGADPTLRNHQSENAVSVAPTGDILGSLFGSVESGGSSHRRLLQAAWQGNKSIVQRLLEESSFLDINCENSDGFTPLLLVTRDVTAFEKVRSALKSYEPAQVARILLEHGANPTKGDSGGCTPLHQLAACPSPLGHQITLMLLAREEGTMQAVDERDSAPIHVASRHGRVQAVVTFLDRGTDVNMRGEEGATPLHVSAASGQLGVAHTLLDRGADVTLVDDRGHTPMDVASNRKMKATLKEAWTEATQVRRGSTPVLSPVKPPPRRDHRRQSSTEDISPRDKLQAQPISTNRVLQKLKDAHQALVMETEVLRDIANGTPTSGSSTSQRNARNLSRGRSMPHARAPAPPKAQRSTSFGGRPSSTKVKGQAGAAHHRLGDRHSHHVLAREKSVVPITVVGLGWDEEAQDIMLCRLNQSTLLPHRRATAEMEIPEQLTFDPSQHTSLQQITDVCNGYLSKGQRSAVVKASDTTPSLPAVSNRPLSGTQRARYRDGHRDPFSTTRLPGRFYGPGQPAQAITMRADTQYYPQEFPDSTPEDIPQSDDLIYPGRGSFDKPLFAGEEHFRHTSSSSILPRENLDRRFRIEKTRVNRLGESSDSGQGSTRSTNSRASTLSSLSTPSPLPREVEANSPSRQSQSSALERSLYLQSIDSNSGVHLPSIPSSESHETQLQRLERVQMLEERNFGLVGRRDTCRQRCEDTISVVSVTSTATSKTADICGQRISLSHTLREEESEAGSLPEQMMERPTGSGDRARRDEECKTDDEKIARVLQEEELYMKDRDEVAAFEADNPSSGRQRSNNSQGYGSVSSVARGAYSSDGHLGMGDSGTVLERSHNAEREADQTSAGGRIIPKGGKVVRGRLDMEEVTAKGGSTGCGKVVGLRENTSNKIMSTLKGAQQQANADGSETMNMMQTSGEDGNKPGEEQNRAQRLARDDPISMEGEKQTSGLRRNGNITLPPTLMGEYYSRVPGQKVRKKASTPRNIGEPLIPTPDVTLLHSRNRDTLMEMEQNCSETGRVTDRARLSESLSSNPTDVTSDLTSDLHSRDSDSLASIEDVFDSVLFPPQPTEKVDGEDFVIVTIGHDSDSKFGAGLPEKVVPSVVLDPAVVLTKSEVDECDMKESLEKNTHVGCPAPKTVVAVQVNNSFNRLADPNRTRKAEQNSHRVKGGFGKSNSKLPTVSKKKMTSSRDEKIARTVAGVSVNSNENGDKRSGDDNEKISGGSLDMKTSVHMGKTSGRHGKDMVTEKLGCPLVKQNGSLPNQQTGSDGNASAVSRNYGNKSSNDRTNQKTPLIRDIREDLPKNSTRKLDKSAGQVDAQSKLNTPGPGKKNKLTLKITTGKQKSLSDAISGKSPKKAKSPTKVSGGKKMAGQEPKSPKRKGKKKKSVSRKPGSHDNLRIMSDSESNKTAFVTGQGWEIRTSRNESDDVILQKEGGEGTRKLQSSQSLTRLDYFARRLPMSPEVRSSIANIMSPLEADTPKFIPDTINTIREFAGSLSSTVNKERQDVHKEGEDVVFAFPPSPLTGDPEEGEHLSKDNTTFVGGASDTRDFAGSVFSLGDKVREDVVFAYSPTIHLEEDEKPLSEDNTTLVKEAMDSGDPAFLPGLPTLEDSVLISSDLQAGANSQLAPDQELHFVLQEDSQVTDDCDPINSVTGRKIDSNKEELIPKDVFLEQLPKDARKPIQEKRGSLEVTAQKSALARFGLTKSQREALKRRPSAPTVLLSSDEDDSSDIDSLASSSLKARFLADFGNISSDDGGINRNSPRSKPKTDEYQEENEPSPSEKTLHQGDGNEHHSEMAIPESSVSPPKTVEEEELGREDRKNASPQRTRRIAIDRGVSLDNNPHMNEEWKREQLSVQESMVREGDLRGSEEMDGCGAEILSGETLTLEDESLQELEGVTEPSNRKYPQNIQGGDLAVGGNSQSADNSGEKGHPSHSRGVSKIDECRDEQADDIAAVISISESHERVCPSGYFGGKGSENRSSLQGLPLGVGLVVMDKSMIKRNWRKASPPDQKLTIPEVAPDLRMTVPLASNDFGEIAVEEGNRRVLGDGLPIVDNSLLHEDWRRQSPSHHRLSIPTGILGEMDEADEIGLSPRVGSGRSIARQRLESVEEEDSSHKELLLHEHVQSISIRNLQEFNSILSSSEGGGHITSPLGAQQLARPPSAESQESSPDQSLSMSERSEDRFHLSLTEDLSHDSKLSEDLLSTGRESSSRERTHSQSTNRSEPEGELLHWKKGNVLGKGAFGTVYCGLTSTGQLIAVKQVDLTSKKQAGEQYEILQEEVELLKTLRHKNIVGFLGVSLEDTMVNIFMQYIPGGSIASLLARFGALEEAVFCRYTNQIVLGTVYLHSNSVIHRDIKGANIMLMSNGVIKLIDFGCAKRLCLQVSQTPNLLKSMKGTPYWMAPEVIMETGHGVKSDVWSVGCTVMEMATRKPPWADMPPMAAIFAIGSGEVIPQLGQKFSALARDFVNICLTRDQEARATSAELLQHPFLAARRGRGGESHRVSRISLSNFDEGIMFKEQPIRKESVVDKPKRRRRVFDEFE